MQQMMAKAGGAAPQQGMNPMAAMMGALSCTILSSHFGRPCKNFAHQFVACVYHVLKEARDCSRGCCKAIMSTSDNTSYDHLIRPSLLFANAS